MLKKIELINENMSEPDSFTEHGYTISYFVRRNPNSQHTEDSAAIYIVDPNTIVLAIADGFGGQKNGELASRFAIEALSENIEYNSEELPLREIIVRAYEDANARILGLANGAATTLVVTEIEKDKIRFFNAGDSIGMLLGGRGKRKLATIQHNPMGLILESGLEGYKRELQQISHVVTNFLGSKDLRIEMTTQKTIARHDRILTFSDGIFDNVDIDKEVNQSLNLCNYLAQKAMKRMQEQNGKIDDLSLIVAGFL